MKDKKTAMRIDSTSLYPPSSSSLLLLLLLPDSLSETAVMKRGYSSETLVAVDSVDMVATTWDRDTARAASVMDRARYTEWLPPTTPHQSASVRQLLGLGTDPVR